MERRSIRRVLAGLNMLTVEFLAVFWGGWKNGIRGLMGVLYSSVNPCCRSEAALCTPEVGTSEGADVTHVSCQLVGLILACEVGFRHREYESSALERQVVAVNP